MPSGTGYAKTHPWSTAAPLTGFRYDVFWQHEGWETVTFDTTLPAITNMLDIYQ